MRRDPAKHPARGAIPIRLRQVIWACIVSMSVLVAATVTALMFFDSMRYEFFVHAQKNYPFPKVHVAAHVAGGFRFEVQVAHIKMPQSQYQGRLREAPQQFLYVTSNSDMGVRLESLLNPFRFDWRHEHDIGYTEDFDSYTLDVNPALPLVLSLVLLICGIRRLRRLRRVFRLESGLCPRCKYDIRMTPVRCPECGIDL